MASSPTITRPSCRQCNSPTWSHTAFLSRFHASLQVSLLASQPTESAAGGEPCGEPAISHDSHHVSLVQWTNLFASHHKGLRFKSPGGYLCETGILLLALSCYTFKVFLCFGPLRRILLCAMGHYGELVARCGPLWWIWLYAMGHCGGFGYALWATARNEAVQ